MIARKRRTMNQQGSPAMEKRFVFNPIRTCPYLGSISLPTEDNDLDEIDVDRQQSDPCEKFYTDIVDNDLEYAFKEANPTKTNSSIESTVIVVGAGLAGLAAAFELEKVGYKVIILERQHRVGGRTKTLREGFLDGLHAEGGAMRIPRSHYLTQGYMNKFKIETRKFDNYNEKAWLYLDGNMKIEMKEWITKNKDLSTQLFPGWDSELKDKGKAIDVDGILDLYKKTIEPVKNDLDVMINNNANQQNGWEAWITKWSIVSVEEFLRSIKHFPETSADFRPWPKAAIKGYQLSSYSPDFGISLVEHLRDELGKWWEGELDTPVDGMDSIAKCFIKEQNKVHLAKRVTFGVNVQSIKANESKSEVTVVGRNIFTGKETTFKADAVIVTVPLTILRHIDINISENKRRAIRDIHYGAATKIVLQFKSRFWEKTVGRGGFTKTDLPIGQLHYPSVFKDERGLLVCYIWGQDAHVFGAQTEAAAVENAVKQVNKIHPEAEEEFEVGMVQAWFSDESAQGAYASLRPFQYIDNLKELMNPEHPIYLAGEAISYTNAWIQGALESGLNAAYELYSHDQKKSLP